MMVQRKDSLCYTEIIRGKYDLKNINYLTKLFNFTTEDEKKKMLNTSFEDLWESLWVNNTTCLRREFVFSRNRFNILKNGYKLRNSTLNSMTTVDMSYMVENSISISEPEWEFPKGRRKPYESDTSCALREFEEESSISRDDIILEDDFKIYEELFIGKNKLRYKNVFYLARYVKNNIHDMFFNKNNHEQIKEIRDAAWFDEAGVELKIEGRVEKKELFNRINLLLKKKYFYPK
jgi:ADP-ribose pyrophosphatase YjhB (NUDIX family)